MDQPWLQVTLRDYEGHMGAAGVDQLAPLGDLFAEALAFCRPRSVAIVGIAGGNGLHHIDPRTVARVVGIDINPDYLRTVRSRFPDLKQLELHLSDMFKDRPRFEPVDMVHVALLFEHTGLSVCLENCISLVSPGGHFVCVLQLLSAAQSAAQSTAFPSIQRLKDHFALIDPASLSSTVQRNGFSLLQEKAALPPRQQGLLDGHLSAQKSLIVVKGSAKPKKFGLCRASQKYPPDIANNLTRY
jgi:hypothetical protein